LLEDLTTISLPSLGYLAAISFAKIISCGRFLDVLYAELELGFSSDENYLKETAEVFFSVYSGWVFSVF
jgi:hypothetical protein